MPASGSDEGLSAKFAVLLPHLDERQRRLLLGAEARELGRGGVARVAAAAGVSRPTVSRGINEILTGAEGGGAAGRVRRPGGGRKSLTETDPGLLGALDALVEPDNRGDPMSPLRWTTKSTRNLADALTAAGHPVSHVRVGELLHASGYSLQGNLKTVEGTQHRDRDAQFRHINTLAKRYLKTGDPVISVESKKKELGSNWPGRPLTSYQVVIELIGATTTRTGLTVHAEADTNSYPRGIKISDTQMASIKPQLKPDKYHGEWNYTVKPATANKSIPQNS
jgi:Rhodopirellula transposase DDE domain